MSALYMNTVPVTSPPHMCNAATLNEDRNYLIAMPELEYEVTSFGVSSYAEGTSDILRSLTYIECKNIRTQNSFFLVLEEYTDNNRTRYVPAPDGISPSLILHEAGRSQNNEIFMEYYYNMNGQLHRENAPAVYRRLGDDKLNYETWLFNGELHRGGGRFHSVQQASGSIIDSAPYKIREDTYFSHGEPLDEFSKEKKQQIIDELIPQKWLITVVRNEISKRKIF